MIGNFKPNIEKHMITQSVCVTQDVNEAYYFYLENEAAFIKKL